MEFIGDLIQLAGADCATLAIVFLGVLTFAILHGDLVLGTVHRHEVKEKEIYRDLAFSGKELSRVGAQAAIEALTAREEGRR